MSEENQFPDIFCCECCGDFEIQVRQWVSLNTGEVVSDCEDGDAWCDSCEAHVRWDRVSLKSLIARRVASWPGGFMVPEVWEENTWAWEVSEGTAFLPRHEIPDEAKEDPTPCEYLGKVVMARLHAPGYIDSTDPTPIRSLDDWSWFEEMYRH